MTTTAQEYGVGVHCHDTTLIELIEGLTERRDYIRSSKPKTERRLRLRLIGILPDDMLPEAVREALVGTRESWVRVKLLDHDYMVRRKALDEEYRVRRKALNEAMTAHMPELEALHSQLCTSCPWDGTTIFPEKTKQ